MKKAKVARGVYSLSELVEMGYPELMLRKLLHSDDFSRFGFRLTPAVNSKAFINKDKLDRYLEHQMDDRNGVFQ